MPSPAEPRGTSASYARDDRRSAPSPQSTAAAAPLNSDTPSPSKRGWGIEPADRMVAPTGSRANGDPLIARLEVGDCLRCWVCGSTDIRPWRNRGLTRPLLAADLRITDHRYGVTLALAACGACGFIFASDTRDVGRLEDLYAALEDPEYEASQDARALQMRWLLDCARRAHPAARTLLDVGAGAGLLVRLARRAGLDAVGVEPSRALAESAPRLNGVDLVHGVLPHPALAGLRFDLVCLVDVIEHVADPRSLLMHAAAVLAPGGLLVVVTPDVGSLAARILGRRWWHFRLAHVGYFDRRSLERALGRAGLVAIERRRAKWFFRIGYLAERVAEYLPVGGINRLATRSKPLARFYQRVIPLNLFDSWAVFARRDPTPERA